MSLNVVGEWEKVGENLPPSPMKKLANYTPSFDRFWSFISFLSEYICSNMFRGLKMGEDMMISCRVVAHLEAPCVFF